MNERTDRVRDEQVRSLETLETGAAEGAERNASVMAQQPAWPALRLDEWSDARDTLHLWLQIVGKVKLASTPWANHWWNVTLGLTARGLTTGLMHHRSGDDFEIELDLSEHQLDLRSTSGARRSIPLRSMTVQAFYTRVMSDLDELGLATRIWPVPVELQDAVPFELDDVHRRYDPTFAHDFWRALRAMSPVFEEFRGRFLGKASPVHFFWGGLDLATSRFSGHTAPAYTRPVPNCNPRVMLEAYSHEVSSCGYWPGGAAEGAFYGYAYPQPPGFDHATIEPADAYWSGDLAEYVLPYRSVRQSARPRERLMTFLQSTYVAAADTGGWARATLERGI